MLKFKINNAIKYFKNSIEYMKFLKKNKCQGCCDLYEYEMVVGFVNPINAWAVKNTDAADLLPFNNPGRSGGSAVHYINWFEIGGINILGNTNWFTDTFRRTFTIDSIGNRNELDYVGNTPQNAASWFKNYNTFINNKIQNNNIKAFHYIDLTTLTHNIDSINDDYYTAKCYVVVPKGVTVGKIQQERYDIAEAGVATNWNYSLVDPVHGYPTTLIKETNCNLI